MLAVHLSSCHEKGNPLMPLGKVAEIVGGALGKVTG